MLAIMPPELQYILIIIIMPRSGPSENCAGTGGTLYSVDPGTGDPRTRDPGTLDPGTLDPGTLDPGTLDPGTRTQGPKLACTVHVRTVASSLGPRAFHAWVCVSNRVEWAIEFF